MNRSECEPLFSTTTLCRYHTFLMDDENITGKSVCAKCGARADADVVFCKNCGATLRPPVPLVQSVSQSAPTHRPILADAVGLLLVAAQLALVFRWLVPDEGTRLITGILAYGVLVASALSMWHGKAGSRFSNAYHWMGVFFGSILLGGMSFGIDILVGSVTHPGISPIKAGTKVGSPFGFILTIFLCPGVTMIAVASIVRSFLVGKPPLGPVKRPPLVITKRLNDGTPVRAACPLCDLEFSTEAFDRDRTYPHEGTLDKWYGEHFQSHILDADSKP